MSWDDIIEKNTIILLLGMIYCSYSNTGNMIISWENILGTLFKYIPMIGKNT